MDALFQEKLNILTEFLQVKENLVTDTSKRKKKKEKNSDTYPTVEVLTKNPSNQV